MNLASICTSIHVLYNVQIYNLLSINLSLFTRRGGTDKFSHVCISNKNQGMLDKGDVSYIQRTNPGIVFENGLPWIAISMNVGVERTSFSSMFF
jgi:hypothetical protein